VIAGISPGASGAGCFETYKSHVEALKQKTITPEQRDDLHRWALRAYHACETGDLPDVDGLFEKLDRKRL
jgi:hypothetical protein